MLASLYVVLSLVGCFTDIIMTKEILGPFDCKESLGKVILIDAFGPFQEEGGSKGAWQVTDLTLELLPGGRNHLKGWLLCKQTYQEKLKEPYSKYIL